MISSQTTIEQAVTTSSEVEALAETTPKAQSELEIVRENEQADARRALTDLGHLAASLARGDTVTRDEIESTLADCYATSDTLMGMIDDAKKVLSGNTAIDAERLDAVDLDAFQTMAESQLTVLHENVAAIRQMMAATEVGFWLARLAAGQRVSQSEKISAKAAAAIESLEGIDASIYGITVPVRTPAIVRSIGFAPRSIEWFDNHTRAAIFRMKEELRASGATCQLPVVTPLPATATDLLKLLAPYVNESEAAVVESAQVPTTVPAS